MSCKKRFKAVKCTCGEPVFPSYVCESCGSFTCNMCAFTLACGACDSNANMPHLCMNCQRACGFCKKIMPVGWESCLGPACRDYFCFSCLEPIAEPSSRDHICGSCWSDRFILLKSHLHVLPRDILDSIIVPYLEKPDKGSNLLERPNKFAVLNVKTSHESWEPPPSPCFSWCSDDDSPGLPELPHGWSKERRKHRCPSLLQAPGRV